MKVLLEPYNPAWTRYFYAEKHIINKALRDIHPAIKHIGSTSVEGMWAKPIIDSRG